MGSKYSCEGDNKEKTYCQFAYFAGFWGVGMVVVGIIIGLISWFSKPSKNKTGLFSALGLIISGIFMISVAFDGVRVTNEIKDCPACPKCETIPAK